MAEVEEFVVENREFIAQYPAFFDQSVAERVFFGRHLRFDYRWVNGTPHYVEVPGPTHVFERINYGASAPSWSRVKTKGLCGVGVGGSWKFQEQDTLFEDEHHRMCPKCAARLRAIQKKADQDA